MPKRKDRTNERYGKLTVLYLKGKDKDGNLIWHCKCDCGNEKDVKSNNLASGRSNSCGCLKYQPHEGQFKREKDREKVILFKQYSAIRKRNIKKFGSADSILSFEEFKELVKKPCFYCGAEYSKELPDYFCDSKSRGVLTDTIVKCNGLDRIDNEKGYEKNNVVPCCTQCNTAKNTLTQKDFFDWVKKVYDIAVKRIEKDENYFAIADKRLDDLQKTEEEV